MWTESVLCWLNEIAIAGLEFNSVLNTGRKKIFQTAYWLIIQYSKGIKGLYKMEKNH